MKFLNLPKSLDGLKKRGQLYLLFLNLMIAFTNLYMLSSRLDNPRMVLYCRVVNFTESICVETKNDLQR